MGLFAEWAMVRLPSQMPADEMLKSEGLVPLGEVGTWAFAASKDLEPDLVASRLARAAGQPALAGWVYDSDFAYLAGADPGGDTFNLLVGEPYSDEGDGEPREELARLASEGGRRRSAEALSRWADQCLSVKMDSHQAVEIVDGEWPFAEEGLQELFSLLALPNLEEAVFSKPEPDSTLDISIAFARVEPERAARLLQRLDGQGLYPQTITSSASGMELIVHRALKRPEAGEVILGEVRDWLAEEGLRSATVRLGVETLTVQPKS